MQVVQQLRTELAEKTTADTVLRQQFALKTETMQRDFRELLAVSTEMVQVWLQPCSRHLRPNRPTLASDRGACHHLAYPSPYPTTFITLSSPSTPA